MNQEVFHFLSNIFNQGEEGVCIRKNDKVSNNTFTLIEPLLAKLISYDCPDSYAKVDDKVLIIEHFEFDSSSRDRKGSKSRKETARIDRQIKSIHEHIQPEDGIVTTVETINQDPSYTNYKNNLKNVFCSHYDKIEDYKRNLREIGIIDNSTFVIVAFIIEDTTPAGNYYKDQHDSVEELNLLNTQFFKKLLKKSSQLNIVFCHSRSITFFLDLAALKKVRPLSDKFIEKHFFIFPKPKTIHVCSAIPSNFSIKKEGESNVHRTIRPKS